jgi:hypothetical protein
VDFLADLIEGKEIRGLTGQRGYDFLQIGAPACVYELVERRFFSLCHKMPKSILAFGTVCAARFSDPNSN